MTNPQYELPDTALDSPVDHGTTAEDLGSMLFMGVGGVGMSGVARHYATRGRTASGSEIHDWPSLPELEKLGVTIFREHVPSNLDGIDTVVRSTVHPDDHSELVEARARGIRVLHRSEALAAATTGRKTIAVAGTHGKTTTNAMITEIFAGCGLDPSFVNGGESIGDGRSGAYGTGEYFILEADESDRSFLRYRPYISVLLNVDVDHLNTYGTMDGLKDGFADFCRCTDVNGTIIVCADDDGSVEIGARLTAEGRTVVTYGTSEDADLRLSDIASDVVGASYQAMYNGEDIGRFTLPVPGEHLARNSAAAVLAGLLVGLEPEAIRKALASFNGVRRRFELRGTVRGIRVYDEYAYQPTAMTAATNTLKGVAGDGRLIVVFQPLRVYRTRDLRAQIAESLAIADKVIVMEVFGPGEDIPEGDGGIALTSAIRMPDDDKRFVPDWDEVTRIVADWAEEGDVVVTMGAPPISLMPDDVLTALAR